MSLALSPSVALANPDGATYAWQAPTTTTTTTTTTVQPQPNDPSLQPTRSKAPKSKDLGEPGPHPEPAPKVESTPEPEPVAAPPPAPEKFNRHGFGIRGGITIIPTWAVRGYVQSLTNALCRGDSIPKGNFGEGLTRVDDCNFYIGGEYIYRYSQHLDIVPSVGWQRNKTPDGLWLDDSEKDLSGNPNLGAADYTQVNFSHVFLQVDFIGRGNLIKTPDFAWQLGGGGGIGLGIVTGPRFYQTALGSPPASPHGGTCHTIDGYSGLCQEDPYIQRTSAQRGRVHPQERHHRPLSRRPDRLPRGDARQPPLYRPEKVSIYNKKRQIAICDEGEAFGEMAVLNRKPRSATAAAKSDVKLFTLDERQINQILDKGVAAKLLLNVIHVLSERLEQANATVAKLRDATSKFE